jgi:excisionase family DNA binding protein
MERPAALTIGEAAAELGCSEDEVRALIRDDELQTVACGVRPGLIPRHRLDDHLRRRRRRRALTGWRDLWDFNDLDLSERRFRAAFEEEGSAALLTQLARVEGLRGDFAAGERLVAEAEALGGAESWVLIERGRLLRSSGDGASALPLFEAAFEQARAAGDGFLAADAAHMAALVGDMEEWTARGIEVTGDGYWRAPLLNNLGWARYDAGDFDRALEAFEEALAVRAADPEQPHEREIARYAVAKTLRALGRIDEATAQLERAVAWAREAGVETPLIDEELAACYAAATSPSRP